MAVFLDFPAKSLKIRNPAFVPAYNTRPGHEATNSMRRALGMSNTPWRMKFDVFVHDEASVRTLRAFLYQMEADTNLVRIPIPDKYGIDGPFATATAAARAMYPHGIPFETGAFYATGVGHAVPTAETFLSQPAALNARDIYVTSTDEIPAGCAISIDEFVYGVAGSWEDEGTGQRIRITPVLRKAEAAGSMVSLAPVFVGYCVTDKPGYEPLTHGMYGEVSLEFVEDLTRLVEDID